MRARFVAAVAVVLAGGCAKDPPTEPGIPRAKSVYVDGGAAPADTGVRALVALRLRDRAALDDLARRLYDPAAPEHRRYLSPADANARFAPTDDDVAQVSAWAASHGLAVARTTSNRTLLELTGTAAAFDDAFSTELHLYTHVNGQNRVLGTPDGIRMPDVAPLAALASLDLAVDGGAAPSSRASSPGAPPDLGLTPANVATAYGLDALYAASARGHGAAIGIVTGGAVREADVRAFWSAFGVARAPHVVRDLMEPAPQHVFEATFDVAWAGVLAPESDVVVYQSPDAATTSLLFAFTEAVTRGEVQVVSDSYAHHESSEPPQTRLLFDQAAELAAVIGTTVIAAAGDSAKPDLPATCPFVTAVGGTTLTLDASGAVVETAWERSGAGPGWFPAPAWQAAVSGDPAHRAVADVALDAGAAYLSVYEGVWRTTGGTSVASPVFAALVAVVDGQRSTRGLAPAGFLNPALYGDRNVQQSFRDITSGGTAAFAAGPGWDAASGWGAPNAAALAQALE